MTEPSGHCQEADNKSAEAIQPKTPTAIQQTDNTTQADESNRQCDGPLYNDSTSLEQSFEVITPPKPSSTMDSDNGLDPVDSLESPGDANDGDVNDAAANKSNKPNCESRENSFQSRLKKSSNFLAKLQSSDDKDGPNIPSSIVSAFSSFSSFTSNFSLNSASNGNNVNSNNGGDNNNSSSLTIETASTSTKLSQIVETREEIFIKKAAIERKNLISLTKLIVKDLISSSLLVSRTFDDCQNAVHLNNYFTLIDRVLKHGLKNNLLSNRSASLWNALDSLPKYLKESTLMSESVRSLANTKTPDGKIKAWMRLAMMQKKLPEYFNELLANKDVLLKDIYHDYAVMLNDEAQVFAGLIIGVNVIDCNFFVKDANFDNLDDIIDLTPYLRAANCYDGDDERRQDDDDDEANEGGKGVSSGLENLTAVLDQKNYLEEWNKRLESTVSDLQAKIRSLEEQNSKLEMEAKLSEARIQKLLKNRNESPFDNTKQTAPGSSLADAFKSLIGNQSESISTKQTEPYTDTTNNQEAIEQSQAERSTKLVNKTIVEPTSGLESTGDGRVERAIVKSDTSSVLQAGNQERVVIMDPDLQQQAIEQERELNSLKERMSILEASYRSALEKIKMLERDLDVQTSRNADRETTIKIYEKDIRDKQAQVESLRASLNDSKKLNSDLSERINDTTTKLKDRIKSVSTLQASMDKWKLENKTLASRLQDKQSSLKSITQELEKAMKTIEDLKKHNEKITDELKKERESGHSSSVTVETQNTRIAELSGKLFRLENELKDVKPYKDQTEELEKKCRDYELSLEEIGSQLRESRLEVEGLKENSAVYLDSQWMDSKQVKACASCQQSFSVTRRKHHCRLCGNVFCGLCSDNKMELASSAKPVRVCDTCHAFLLAKFVKSPT